MSVLDYMSGDEMAEVLSTFRKHQKTFHLKLPTDCQQEANWLENLQGDGNQGQCQESHSH